MALKTFDEWQKKTELSHYLRVGDTIDDKMLMRLLGVSSPHFYRLGLLQLNVETGSAQNEQGELQDTYLTFKQEEKTGTWVFKGACFSNEYEINRNPSLEPQKSVGFFDVYENENLTSEQLRIYYRNITGLDNDIELSDVEVQCYLLDTLAETPLEREKSEKFVALHRFEQKILSQLADKGFDISQIQLDVQHFIDDEHQHCLWYGSTVATVEYKDCVFWLQAHGDVSASLLNENDEEIAYVRDKYNSGEFYHEFSSEIANDEELERLLMEGSLVLNNNNWFEVTIETPDGKMLEGGLFEDDYLDECIVNMIFSMDLMLEKIGLVEKQFKEIIQSLDDKLASAGKRSATAEKNELIEELEKE